MRSYILGSCSILLALGFSAFNKTNKSIEDKKQTVLYFVFNAAQPVTQEKNILHYTNQPTRPGVPADGSCPGQGKVCWFRVTDLNGDGLVTSADFNIRANQLDTDSDGIISDNQADAQLNIYEERF
jgi:hypothetical protein